MNCHNDLDTMKKMQQNLLFYIDCQTKIEENFQNILSFCNENKILDDLHDIRLFLHILIEISINHYRGPNFFEKIEKILHFCQESIKKYFYNLEIFNLFKDNKRILLFFIDEKMLLIDQQIYDIMTSNKYLKHDYHLYYMPELLPFNISQNANSSQKLDENFNEKRSKAENDDYVCQVIRKDQIEEFITYTKKTDYSLSALIKKSIYETNSFLLNEKETTLIEYSAFYGSIQIFKYLYKNQVKLRPSLWLYAIHGDNPEIISILEENKIEPKDKSYNNCLIESIKCHHNDITNYILNNYSKKDDINFF